VWCRDCKLPVIYDSKDNGILAGRLDPRIFGHCSDCKKEHTFDGHLKIEVVDSLYGAYEAECEAELLEDKSEVKSEAIKSDGGKSDYYKITIDGQTFMIEKIIKQVFRNDFDFGNAFKALIRANALIAGGGKEGSTIEYEMNKVKYSADQVVENNE
jgi:hypothetical protein